MSQSRKRRRLVEHLAAGGGRREGLGEERLQQRAP
jgi:hypothetical protein